MSRNVAILLAFLTKVLQTGALLASISPKGVHVLKKADFVASLSLLLKETNRSIIFQDKPPRIRGLKKKKDRRKGEKRLMKGTCGVSVQVGKFDKKDEYCPSECPYYVQDKTDDQHCTFVCVKAEDCTKFSPKTPFVDDYKKVCRGPVVNHCREYDYSKLDTCAVCQSMYRLESDGQCYSQFKWALYALAVLLVFLVAYAAWWVTSMTMREPVNQKALDKALDARELQKIRMPKEHGRKIWDIDTNLLTTQVAGAGMLLHFNFQAVIILWATLVGLGWVILAAVVDYELFTIGTRRFGTPRDNCILVAWGFWTQQRLMWTKILFLAVVYVASTFLCMWHGIRQLRLFQGLDIKEKTMKDFAAMADGLPSLSGDKRVEEDLKKAFCEATGQNLVGVSVAWDYKDQQEEVMKFLSKGLDSKDPKSAPLEDVGTPESDKEKLGFAGKKFYALEQYLFEEAEVEGEETEEEQQKKEMKDLLHNMTTTSEAFFVFETQAECEEAVRKVNETNGFKFGDAVVKLCLINNEPDTVQWWHFGHSSLSGKLCRLFIGFGCIFLGLVCWTVFFYAPYAWSIFSFNYDNGQQPGIVYSIAFSMVVVVGNNIMYEVCARVSDYVGFRFKDDKEACYMILYTIACTFNILLDMVTTYFMAWEIMKGLGFRTWDGRKLHTIEGFNERFETYAMQRSLAENTFAYAFPSTYLIPFLIEPFVIITLPLRVGVLIVRNHSRIQGHSAEEWVASIPFEFGRYADILLNVVLGILIFFFPGGYTHTLFLAMAASHLFIYAFDHARVLKVIPACKFSTMDIDWWSQAMLAPCCALILSAFVFKANGRGYGFDFHGRELPVYCTLAFFAHCVVHILLLIYAVPLFGLRDQPDPSPNTTFKDVAQQNACSWFNCNPVNCLRSELIYEHKVPCAFWVSGREHLLELNEEIGCFFKDEAAQVDRTELFESVAQWMASAKSRLSVSKSEPAPSTSNASESIEK